MATLIYLDTHVVAWLYAGEVERLSATARGLIEEHDTVVSPMVSLELEFLKEIGRLRPSSGTIIEALRARIGLAVCHLDFARVVAAAREQSWTRDPFDRIIVGQALAAGEPLLTKDRTIRRRYARAIW